ncbi:MAG: hypothetical protein ACK5ME_09990 [Parahaliea sp.]
MQKTTGQINYAPLSKKVTPVEREIFLNTFDRKEKVQINRWILVILAGAALWGMTLFITPINIILILFIVASILLVEKLKTNKLLDYSLRLWIFSRANNWKYEHKSPVPTGGFIFELGHFHCADDTIYVTHADISFAVGSISYTIKHDKNNQTLHWLYVSIPLSQKLPHMLLDAKQNDTSLFGIAISNLPKVFTRRQKISLGEDFDKYFTLYAPKGYEHDVRTVLTPEVMAILIDKSPAFDVEIVDDKLFFIWKAHGVCRQIIKICQHFLNELSQLQLHSDIS